MLSAKYRMRSSDDFARTIQGGKRQHTSTVTVYASPCPSHIEAGLSSKVGFVVSKKVGNSVVRHRVVRQLRHAVKPLLLHIQVPTFLVVRARPNAATVSFSELSRDLTYAFEKLGLVCVQIEAER